MPMTENKYEIIVQPNKYYPLGLSKKNIFDYYAAMAPVIMQHMHGRPVAFKLITDKGPVFARSLPGGSIPFTIQDTKEFHAFNNGRRVDLYSIYYDGGDFAWVDIDGKIELNKLWAFTKNLAQLVKTSTEVESVYLRFSGSRGFHICAKLRESTTFSRIRTEFEQMFQKFVDSEIGISDPKKPINIDLATLHANGALRVPYTINSKTGLLCSPVFSSESDIDPKNFTIYSLFSPLGDFSYDPNSTQNEGRFRFLDPKEFDPSTFRRHDYWAKIRAPRGVQFLTGMHNSGRQRLQTIRFNKSLWPEKEAQKWLDFIVDRPEFERTWNWHENA